MRIVNNTIHNCEDTAIAVYAFGGTTSVAPAGAHNNIHDKRQPHHRMPTAEYPYHVDQRARTRAEYVDVV